MTSRRCSELIWHSSDSSCNPCLVAGTRLLVLGGLFLACILPFGPETKHLEQTNFHFNSCNFIPLQVEGDYLTPNPVPRDPPISCSRNTYPTQYSISESKTHIQTPNPQPFPQNLFCWSLPYLLHTIEDPYLYQLCLLRNNKGLPRLH